MSYILDALQRAEAERERGSVPGLKSQLVPPMKREPAARWALRPWHALAGLALLLLVLGTWWWTGSAEPSPAGAASTPPAALASGGEPAAAAPATPAPEAVPGPAASPAATTGRAAPAEAVLPILAPPRPAPAPPKAAASPTPAAAAPSATTAAPAPASVPASAPPAVPSFGQLTAEARAQLPAVNVSGSTYSQNPALRMLIANGKVVHEGQEVAPGLRLETIGPRSAVLNHQGMRYSIGY